MRTGYLRGSTHSFIEHFVSDLETGTTKLGKKGGVEASGALRAKPQWIPPERGFLKVNVDAAISKNSNVAAMTAVARDEARVFMGASALVVNDISDPETAEVMACREGLALAIDLLGGVWDCSAPVFPAPLQLHGTKHI
jgi:hypothetical protein